MAMESIDQIIHQPVAVQGAQPWVLSLMWAWADGK